eukprot:scaffold1564_cov389-Prasinococcus_capsulatus_cf.AAC.31
MELKCARWLLGSCNSCHSTRTLSAMGSPAIHPGSFRLAQRKPSGVLAFRTGQEHKAQDGCREHHSAA